MKTILLSAIMSISMPQMMQMMRECPMNVLTIPGTVTYEATPNGAQLTFTPNDPARLDAFQKQVREFGERMNKGGSGMMMMQKMMEGMTNPEAKSKEEHHPDKH